VAHGVLGPVEPDEIVARVVCDPRHLTKNGSIKPGVFPPSHIAKKGLSLMRPGHLTAEGLKMHSDAVAAHDVRDTAVGVIECKASIIRALVDADGTRSVCLFDDPVIDEPALPDNLAHALLIVAKEVPDEDVAEIRTRLLLAFGDLRRFAA
jgi:hypothetical protein